MKKIILFELNEVPFFILNSYSASTKSDIFKDIISKSRHYKTFATDTNTLSPWITWPTLHRGVNDDKHGIIDFNQQLDEVDAFYPPIWKLLAKQNVNVGVCGSLHSEQSINSAKYNFFIPDFFSSSEECIPDYLNSFQDFNLFMSRASARNISNNVNILRAAKFLLNSPRAGIKTTTGFSIARHLLSELKNKHFKSRRRTIQSVLLFDVFYKQLLLNKPDFCSFFTNHVASSMHRFWAAAFPSHYTNNQMSQSWIEQYKNEIYYTMHAVEKMLVKLKKFADSNNYQIWITSSMGQSATVAKPVSDCLCVKSTVTFMKKLGLSISAYEIKPAMHPQFNFSVSSEHAKTIEAKLSRMTICGKKLKYRQHESVFSLDIKNKNKSSEHHVVYDGSQYSLEEFGLGYNEIEEGCDATAYHIPEGILLIYDKEFVGRPESIELDTKDVAPAILKNFGLKVPGYMQGYNAIINS